MEGHIAYISTSDLSSRNRSFLDFVNLDSVPLDGRTNIFTLDYQGNLIVVVDNVTLIAIICEGDFISFGYYEGTCEMVQIAPQGSVPIVSSSTPMSSAPVSPSVSNLTSIPPISSEPRWELPSSQHPSSYPYQPYPSSTYVSSTPPSSSPDPSSAPSNEPSASPSSIPASEPVSSLPPAPTLSVLMAAVSSSNLDQGNGTSLADTSIVDLTSYDQYNATLAGANFTLECDDPSDLCVFRLDPHGSPVTSLTMGPNGTAEFYFNSVKAGFKCVRIFNEAHQQVKAFPVIVRHVVDCNAGTIAITNVTNPSSLLLGLDQPVLQSTVLDLNEDPISGQPVTFQQTVGITIFLNKRVPPSAVLTSGNGTASFPALPLFSNGAQCWSAATSDCPTKTFPEMDWQYGVNCGASSIIPSRLSLFKDESLTITGVYLPMPGCMLDNASVSIQNGASMPVPVALVGGVLSYTVSFSALMASGPQVLPLSVDFIGSSTLCLNSWEVTWLERPPSCDQQSTVAASPSNPVDVSQVTMTIIARDELGNLLVNTLVTVTSNTRIGLPSSFTYTGVTDVNGLLTVSYTNNNYGNGNDDYQVGFTRGGNTCFITGTVIWNIA